jgi:hypothetical protein
MDQPEAATSRWRVAACALIFSLPATVATSATDVFVIRQSLVANGGGFVHDNCYRLFTAIGQPVLGNIGNAEFALASGFLAEVPSTDDKLFRSGFESSTGVCKP